MTSNAFPEEPGSELSGDAKRSLFVIGAGYFVFLFCDMRDGIGKLAIKFLLKDQLHVNEKQMAGFMAIAVMAWYFKPIAGLLTDSIPLFRTRRRHYLLLSTGVAALFWLLVGLVPRNYSMLLLTLVGLNIAFVFGQTTLGGLLVERGKSTGATGRMSSLRSAMENLSLLIAGPIAGWLGSHALRATVGANIAFLIVGGLVFYFFALEKPLAIPNEKVWDSAWFQLKQLARSPAMWITAGLWFMVRFSPGFQSAFFFYQTNT